MTYKVSYRAYGRFGPIEIQNHAGQFLVRYPIPMQGEKSGYEKVFNDWNDAQKFAADKKRCNEWTLWFNDGGGRQLLVGREQLDAASKKYDFDADRVFDLGGIDLIDDDGDVIGGVYTN
jgi:hypothetical protein